MKVHISLAHGVAQAAGQKVFLAVEALTSLPDPHSIQCIIGIIVHWCIIDSDMGVLDAAHDMTDGIYRVVFFTGTPPTKSKYKIKLEY